MKREVYFTDSVNGAQTLTTTTTDCTNIPEGYREAPLTWLDRWFIKWHGIGDGHQALLYRCVGCRRIMTHTSISRGLCGCGINKVTPANPSWLEIIRLYLLPWTVK